MKTLIRLLGLSLPLLLAAAPLPALCAPQEDCHVGSYRLEDGSNLDIAPSEKDTLRWRKFDGSTGALHPQADGSWSGSRGWTGAPDGLTVSFSGCDTIRFGGVAGTRNAFEVRDTTFESPGTRLAGRLLLPRGDAPVPVVVLVHGSEPDSAIASYSLQRMLPAEGIGAFVYDKRGTGQSGGT